MGREHCIRRLFSGNAGADGLDASGEDSDSYASNTAGALNFGEKGCGDRNMQPGRGFNRCLAEALFGDDVSGHCPRQNKILQIGENGNTMEKRSVPHLRDVYDQNRALHDPTGARTKRDRRHICSTPDRILDSPNIIDDYYLNLLDWSSQNGKVS